MVRFLTQLHVHLVRGVSYIEIEFLGQITGCELQK